MATGGNISLFAIAAVPVSIFWVRLAVAMVFFGSLWAAATVLGGGGGGSSSDGARWWWQRSEDLGVDEESTKLGSCSGASLSTNFNQSQNATNFVTALARASSSSGPGEAPIQNLFKIEPNQTDVSKGRITLSNEFVNKHIVPYLNESQKEILPRREAFHISTVDDQSHQLKMPGLKQKKAHLMEIQVNGGDVAKKVEYAYSFFEKHLPIDVVFQKDEMIDIIVESTLHALWGCQKMRYAWRIWFLRNSFVHNGGIPNYYEVLWWSRNFAGGYQVQRAVRSENQCVKLYQWRSLLLGEAVDYVLSRSFLDASYGNIISAIAGLRLADNSVKIRTISSLANHVAQRLAINALVTLENSFWMEDFPNCIRGLLQAEMPL
ncbi:hypothetical protein QYF36_007042 [Acer negundo]|nr:hypothetical protein QYF36_007042 [Acer negundo]